ncbi:hypothetical protein ACFSCV_17125 [Methylopila henanensis]|uniref:Uncharacterized protein n=1 Tax=Methylopila henanensis TaxID=873516 RepID=A0ABW4KB33_9HYPH
MVDVPNTPIPTTRPVARTIKERFQGSIPTFSEFRQSGFTDQQTWNAINAQTEVKLVDLEGATITLSAPPVAPTYDPNAKILINGTVTSGGVDYLMPFSDPAVISSRSDLSQPTGRTPHRFFVAASERFSGEGRNLDGGSQPEAFMAIIASNYARVFGNGCGTFATTTSDVSSPAQTSIISSRFCEAASERSLIVGSTMCRTSGPAALTDEEVTPRWGLTTTNRITNNTGVAQPFPPAGSQITYQTQSAPIVLQPGQAIHKRSLNSTQEAWLTTNGWLVARNVPHTVWPQKPNAYFNTATFCHSIISCSGVEVAMGSNNAAITSRGRIWSIEEDTVELPSQINGSGNCIVAVEGFYVYGQYNAFVASANVISTITDTGSNTTHNFVGGTRNATLGGPSTRQSAIIGGADNTIARVGGVIIGSFSSTLNSGSPQNNLPSGIYSSVSAFVSQTFSTVIGSLNVFLSGARSHVFGGRNVELVDADTVAFGSSATAITQTGANQNVRVAIKTTTGDITTVGKVKAAALEGVFPGPYASDAAAASAGVPVNGTYRKTGGTLAWRVS